MQNEDWIALFERIPPEIHNQLVVVTPTGLELTIETIFRTDPAYLVARGRQAGTTDAGRVFFVPYDQITFLKIERDVKENEVRAMYGDELLPEIASPLDAPKVPEPPAAAEATPAAPPPTPIAAPTRTPTESPGPDAKAKLLERIRATRQAQSAAPPRSPTK